MEAETLLNPSTRAQMRQRDPGVLRIPDDRGDRTESESDKEQIQTGPRKLLSDSGGQ